MSFDELFRAKKVNLRLSVLAGVVLLSGSLSAQTPNFAGNWQMDPAKSQVSDGRLVLLIIESAGNKFKVSATIRDKGGKETASDFICAPDGKECAFNEGGHKSKLSMWFSGDALNLAKTDGPPGDVVDMWKLETSSGGKVLTLSLEHVDPNGPKETLVFAKKET
jgi:hypothetical protein